MLEFASNARLLMLVALARKAAPEIFGAVDVEGVGLRRGVDVEFDVVSGAERVALDVVEGRSFVRLDLLVAHGDADDGGAGGVVEVGQGEVGLADGYFKVQMNNWWGANATSYALFQNGKLICAEPLLEEGDEAQSSTVTFGGLADGTYVYTAVLANSAGTTATSPVTVKVTDAAPADPVVSDYGYRRQCRHHCHDRHVVRHQRHRIRALPRRRVGRPTAVDRGHPLLTGDLHESDRPVSGQSPGGCLADKPVRIDHQRASDPRGHGLKVGPRPNTRSGLGLSGPQRT